MAGCGSKSGVPRSPRWIARLRIGATGPGQTVGGLSGGNQQKVALARLLHQQADVLLLDEPTRGIDVGSKAEIYRLIGELAAQGKAILVVSSYLPELFGICDRIAVMSRGTLCEARPVSQWTEHEVMEVATRGDSDARLAVSSRTIDRKPDLSLVLSAVLPLDRGQTAVAASSERIGRTPAIAAARHPGLGLDGLRPVPGAGLDHRAVRRADPRVGPVPHASTTGGRSPCRR